MINDVVLEGIVVKAWKFADDLLFRLACFLGPDQPTKLLDAPHNSSNFVTIHVMSVKTFSPQDNGFGFPDGYVQAIHRQCTS